MLAGDTLHPGRLLGRPMIRTMDGKRLDNSGRIGPTLPVFLQGYAPLSERLSLAVHVVFVAVPEIVTVYDVVSLPQMIGSSLAVTQLRVRAWTGEVIRATDLFLPRVFCLRASLASLDREGAHTIWPIGLVRAALGLHTAECLGRWSCHFGS